MEPKSIFKSKTFWLNAAAAAFAGFQAFVQQQPPSTEVMILVAILNIANRFITRQPVTV